MSVHEIEWVPAFRVMKQEDEMEYRLTTYDDLSVGQTAQLSKTITEDDIERFVKITGDVNPLHIDEQFAKRTFFKKRVVHGMLTASLFSTLVGMYLPGIGAIYRSQTLEFLRPVYVGDTVTASLEITKIDPEKEIIEIDAFIRNQEGAMVVKGKATASLIRNLRDIRN